MPTEAKRETVAELREELTRSTAVVVSEYRGLKVSELGEIRRALRKQNVSYRVVKNRLMRIAANEAGSEALGALLVGPTALAFGSGDEAALAKTVLDVMRPYAKVVKVTGAVVGGRSIDADGVVRLSTLPGREVLLARLAGAIQAPTATLAGLLGANLRNLGYALQQVAEQKARAQGA